MDVFLRQIEQENKVPNTMCETEIIQAKLKQLDVGLTFFQPTFQIVSKIQNLRRVKI